MVCFQKKSITPSTHSISLPRKFQKIPSIVFSESLTFDSSLQLQSLQIVRSLQISSDRTFISSKRKTEAVRRKQSAKFLVAHLRVTQSRTTEGPCKSLMLRTCCRRFALSCFLFFLFVCGFSFFLRPCVYTYSNVYIPFRPSEQPKKGTLEVCSFHLSVFRSMLSIGISFSLTPICTP